MAAEAAARFMAEMGGDEDDEAIYGKGGDGSATAMPPPPPVDDDSDEVDLDAFLETVPLEVRANETCPCLIPLITGY